MKTWDVIIVGGGIIGLSLAIALRKRGLSVLIVERGEPGREASYAAAGMLADSEVPAPLRALASASARMYPEFVHELQDESGLHVDLRDQGTLLIAPPQHVPGPEFNPLASAQLLEMETALKVPEFSLELPTFYSNEKDRLRISGSSSLSPVFHLTERSADPRDLVAAALIAAKHREVDIASGSAATAVLCSGDRAIGVATNRTAYHAPLVVNCAGAWAGQLPPLQFPTRPVRGQMLAVVKGPRLNHVIRAPEVYLVPRSDGRIVIGATIEEAGYDKRTNPDTIQRLRQAAIRLVPDIAASLVLEAWAGLRPGTPDDLPILGATELSGYFVAAGHFRDGILLAPVTAQVMAQVVMGEEPGYDLTPFSPARFASAPAAI